MDRLKRYLILLIPVLLLLLVYGILSDDIAYLAIYPEDDLPPTAAASGTLEWQITNVTRGQGSAAQQIEAARKQALDGGLQPFLQMTAPWCHLCQTIEQSLEESEFHEALRGVHLVRIDIEQWSFRELKEAGYGKPQGLPYFTQLDGLGWSGYQCPSFGANNLRNISHGLKRCVRTAPQLANE